MLRSEITGGFVDAARTFLESAKKDGQPSYINVWPDDVHSPFWPPTDRWAESKRDKYLAVLETMDQQLGGLFHYIKEDPYYRDNTLILICSDNGPEKGAGRAGPFRGFKTHLYEGGIRSSLIAWGPRWITKKGHVNKESVFSAIDLVPSLLEFTGISPGQEMRFDGEPLLGTLLGNTHQSRVQPLFFRRPPDRNAFYGVKDLPDLAVRHHHWKLLCEYDGSQTELYDLGKDPGETNDLAERYPEKVDHLKKMLLEWHHSMPPDKGSQWD